MPAPSARCRNEWRVCLFTQHCLVIAFIALLGLSARAFPAAPLVMERQADGMSVQLAAGELRIQVISDSVVRVEFSRSPEFFNRISIDRVPLAENEAPFAIGESDSEFSVATEKLRVIVDRTTGNVSFTDKSGALLLSEVPGSRLLEPATVQGEETFHVQQKWRAQKDESLYGLGQMQLGIVDIKGYDLDLWQHNTNVVVPFLVSSKGYGIFWDNTSFTRFGDLRPFAPIPAADLYGATGKAGGLSWRRRMVASRLSRLRTFRYTCPSIPTDAMPTRRTARAAERGVDRHDSRTCKRGVSVPGLLQWRHQGLA